MPTVWPAAIVTCYQLIAGGFNGLYAELFDQVHLSGGWEEALSIHRLVIGWQKNIFLFLFFFFFFFFKATSNEDYDILAQNQTG